MSREDQRLMLVGSALTGIMAQHLSETTESGLVHVDAAHYKNDELADAVVKAVKVADLALTALGARIPDKGDVYEMLGECWALFEKISANNVDWPDEEAKALLAKQKGGSNDPR